MVESLSLPQARRVALAAQGFTDPAPGGVPDRRHLRRVLRRVGLLQIDSVNIVQRAHYMPLYSRLGPYPTTLLDQAAYRAPRELFEYWAHEASLVPVGLHPALRWRMAGTSAWQRMVQLARERPELVRWVLDEVRDRGPLTAAEVEAAYHGGSEGRTGSWGWSWSDVKAALEWLFRRGEVTTAGRSGSFARIYDVPERVLPAEVLATPTPTPADAFRELVRVAAIGLGVAAEPELRDYFRLRADDARVAIGELVELGELIPVAVEGWQRPAYLHAAAKIPRRIGAATLISPFDPVMWLRERVSRLFGFDYRIEIYVPAPQRRYGYYVLPFLLDDQLVARLDLKADRQAGVLRVPAAWIEPAAVGRDGEVAEALAAELHRLAGWLGLASVEPPVAGDFAVPLRRAMSARHAAVGSR